MAEVVNLRLARKRAERSAKERTAAENRERHGRTKAERLRNDYQAAASQRFVDGHKIDRGNGADK